MKNYNLIEWLWTDSHEKQSPQRFGRYAAMLMMLLTLGVGQMWADVDYVVGCAATNSNNYSVRLNVNRQEWGWYEWTMSKAGLTFEGKKLYIKKYETKNGWVNDIQFLMKDGSGTQKEYKSAYAGSGTQGYSNQIYNYDGGSWYSKQTVETGARFYFDASTWDETSIKLVVGHANYQRYSSLTNVTNTKLYYGNSGNRWTDAMHIGVVGSTTASDGTNWPTDISDKATEFTGLKNYGLTATSSGNAYLMVPNGDSGEKPSMSYNASHTTLLNSTQTIKYAVGVNGGTPAELTSGYVPADIAISSYKFSSGKYNAVDASSGSVTLSKGGSNYSATVTAARTATTTYTVSNVHEDYSFLGWYSAPSGGTLLSSELSYTFYPTSATTAYARFSKENNHTVTISRYCISTSTEINNTSAKIGEVTYSSIEAPVIYGYTFVNWSLGSGVTKHSSDAVTSNPIRVITAASGTYTLTANYTEDLTTNWYISGATGTNYPFTGWGTSGTRMSKKTGHSTEEIYYCNITVNRVASGDEYAFQTYNSDNSTYYGYNGKDIDKAHNSTTVYSGNPTNMKFKPYLTGTYEFKLDNTGANPVLTVTWPVYNQVRISAASPSDASNVGNYDLSEPVSNVRTVTRSLKANTTYTFKVVYNSDWYGHSTGTFTRSNSTSSNSRTLETSSGNLTLTTDYAGDYTFRFNQSTKALSVDFPTAYKVTYGKGTVDGSSSSCSAKDIDNGNASVTSNSTWVKSGNRVVLTAPVAKTGYTYDGWFDNNSGTGAAITTNANCTITVSSAETYYACYHENLTAVTITTDGHGTITTPNPNESPYSLGVATMQNINASANTGYHWNTWTVSGTAALNSSAATQSNKAKGDGTVGGTGTVTATFSPNTYRVQFHRNGASEVTVYQNFTYDVAQNLTANTYTRTGYTFAGWATSTSGEVVYANGANVSNLTATNEGTYHLYAKWTPNPYTVVLDKQTSAEGYGGNAGTVGDQTVTFDATPATVSGTMPSAANGYAFMGFYSATGGNGRRFIDPSGNWVTSAGDTISGGNWVKPAGITLYAYYKKAEITALAFDAGTVEPEATVGVTPTISPTPEGTTIICWTILHSNDTPLDPQPSMTWSDGKLTFAASAYSGTYKVQAILRKGSGCEGAELDTETASFLVAGSHTVTVNYKCSSEVIKTATSVIGSPTDWSDDITAPDIFGYTFSGWSSADGVTIKDSKNEDVTSSTDATIKIKATYAGSLTANYTQKQMIYFKNTLGWSNVYVNFYTDSYWNNPKGSGNHGVTNKNLAMTQYGETDIWYYDYGASSITPSLYVSFTSESQSDAENFWKSGGVNVVYPANYQDAIHTNKSSENGFKAATPMFVPLATQEKVTLNQSSGGKADYYNAGYWTTYTPGTGYRLEIYNSDGSNLLKYADFESADDLMPMKVDIDLEGGQTYKFQIRRGGAGSAGVYYGNSGTMTYTNHGQDTPWSMTNSSFSMAGITTNAAGNYTFNLSYSPNSTGQYRLRVAVDYPVKSGDYRLVYSDAVQTKPLTSAIVNQVNDGTDIVSFFVRPGSTPVLRIQQASIDGSTVTWNEYPTSGTPTNQITGTIASTLSSSGTEVYNFNLSMNGSGALTVASAEVYDGKFYIRTDAANSKWDNYRTDPDHVMTYSEYSITHGGYTHYYTHWVDKDDVGRKNVKFVIANDYSPNITDTLARETASGTWANIASFMEEGGDLKRSANVRFMWDKRDNSISRAYVDGAQGDYSSNFLYMLNVEAGADKIKTKEGTALTDHKVTFKDNGNWMYEANIKAQPTAQIKLLSNWGTENTITQYFRGASDATETLLGGSGSTLYDIRVIYDFKTNRLIAGLIPSGTIDDQMAIHADVMFIREHHGDIAQLTFAEKDSKMGAITDIETAYGVLQFNKWTINNKSKADGHSPLIPLLSRFERDIFYISFPFRVSMEEVFGFGTYGQHWIIEEYDGAGRATNGYWQESDPNWKFVFNRKNKFFEPGTGYVIALDLDEMGESADIWANTDQVELYFPSYGTMDNITSSTATYNIPEHLCTINRSNESNGNGGTLGSAYDRRVKDSHWNVLGVPTYVNPDAPSYANTAWTTSATETSVGPNFLYEWNKDDNSLSAVSASDYTYHAMHAYLVQYCGNVTWTSSVSVMPPAIIAAHRTSEERPQSVEFRLEMLQNGEAVDQTFVKLSDNEAVTTGFEFNYDLSKEFNSGRANIYTLIGTEPVAGNVLPMTDQTTVVPVGVIAKTNGDYTFSMPDGTEGIGITLVDTETGVRTILSALDYTVNLTAGTYDNRFLLEISPIMQTPTDIENVQGDNVQGTKVRKVMVDGILYIVKDGQVFDAQGRQVK